MRKIKRFVLNDSFTVLSADAQKKVLGGQLDVSADPCSGSASSSCSGMCIMTYVYSYWGPGKPYPQIPDLYTYGGPREGNCEWDSSSNSCSCVIK